MRIASLTAALVVLTSIVAVGATASAERQQPRLMLAATAPVTVTGRGFRGRERVRLVATLDEQRRSRVVRASTLGTFTAQFDTLYKHPCSAEGTVRATGSLGSLAGTKIPPGPDCPPPP
jgi:hypothetical protein